jgi:hypothetical protein
VLFNRILKNLQQNIINCLSVIKGCQALVAHACNPVLRRLIPEGSWFKASLGKQFMRPPSPKITRQKWARVVGQVVECLLCKHKILSSNPSPMEKKEKNTR